MKLAFHQSGHHAGTGRVAWRRVVGAACCALLAAACVALPDVEDKPVPAKSILIHKDKVQASLDAPAVFPLEEDGFYWRLPAVTAVPSDMKLDYYWYYDFDPKATLNIERWQICGGKESCYVSVCALPQPTLARHRLWAVVSNGPHKAQAGAPLEFEDGVVFDAVIFEIVTTGTCP